MGSLNDSTDQNDMKKKNSKLMHMQCLTSILSPQTQPCDFMSEHVSLQDHNYNVNNQANKSAVGEKTAH